ncbi:hypothetical protein A6J40_12035 [Legionella longbeachae]|uniref:hypothetical protein n=1 Tax=Legionella longbeachae TaxID=450 RepID=UPI0009B775D8|nr:hypothetical protein [Legionella longbeachae]ARB92861.1 hypothetical protein A6J40_12035 [Legionella longbeachae]RZV26510.1 hypothetical protein EKG34_05055 [Legionella longbeachae]UAK47251.1 hypothetical protein K8O86_03405 [Legionella longbeachae]VEE04316.1 Uncharacterised protein [Legionella oakridgensis]
MMDEIEKEHFKEQLEQKGLSTVEEGLAQGIYGDAKGKRAIAENWVKTKKQEQNISHKQQALSLQQESNKIARLALWISGVALLVSILVAIFK